MNHQEEGRPMVLRHYPINRADATRPSERSQVWATRAILLIGLIGLVVALAACGGGGGGATAAPAAAPAQTAPPPAAAPAPATAPAPTPAAAPATPTLPPPPVCADPKTVYVQLFGDSTIVGMYNSGALQAQMHARYGAGIVINGRGVGGTDSTQLRGGSDGRNDPWPGSVDADIVVVEGGLNEVKPWRATPIGAAEFRGNFETFATAPAQVVFLTPNSQLTWAKDSGLPQVIRDVAREHGIPVADADAYVRTVPGWGAMVPDGVHPSDALYALIARDVLMPTLQPLIDPLRCRATAP